MIRHIIISHDTKNEPTLKDIDKKEKDIQNKFLHSKNMNQTYRKIK